MSEQIQTKKLIAFVILVIFAILIWHKRIVYNKSTAGDINASNPFVEIREVPLKLESIKIPVLKKNKSSVSKEKKKWGRNPFELGK